MMRMIGVRVEAMVAQAIDGASSHGHGHGLHFFFSLCSIAVPVPLRALDRSTQSHSAATW
jgi:hypothetical protein